MNYRSKTLIVFQKLDIIAAVFQAIIADTDIKFLYPSLGSDQQSTLCNCVNITHAAMAKMLIQSCCIAAVYCFHNNADIMTVAISTTLSQLCDINIPKTLYLD